MQKYAAQAALSLSALARTPLPRICNSRPIVRRLHTSSPHFKHGKQNKREEKQAKKQSVKNQLDAAEEWVEKHNPSYTQPKLGKRASLLQEADPFEMDGLSQRLKDAVDRFRKDGVSIRQGRSDPELIRGLQVDLPEELGGKTPFLDIATIGPKPGDARQLLMTVFDAENYPTLNPQPAPKNEMQLFIPLPPMTKEKRLENQKKVKDLSEKQKVVVRNIRQGHIKLIKTAVKEDPGIGKDAVTRIEKEVEKEIKSTLEEIDRIAEQLKTDIMTA